MISLLSMGSECGVTIDWRKDYNNDIIVNWNKEKCPWCTWWHMLQQLFSQDWHNLESWEFNGHFMVLFPEVWNVFKSKEISNGTNNFR